MSERARAKRVAEMVRKEIAALIAKGLKDPRIGFVSIMEVRMSPDLRYANVYVSLYGEEAARKSSLVGLRNSAGWIRREIGRHLRMRYTPEVRFFPDDTLDQVYHLEEIFEDIHANRSDAPMRMLELGEVLGELRGAKRILITSHENADGDAIGSMLGLRALLRALGKTQIVCVLENPVPRLYRNLPGAGAILSAAEPPEECDLAVLLDASSIERTGGAAQRWLPSGLPLLVIDHHLGEGPAGAAGFIDPSYAAVGEIVAELFEAAELPLTREAAHCIYVAQITDTGGYRYSNTSARSHRIAARLHETGLDTAQICGSIFDVISMPKFELLRLVLDRMAFFADGRCAHTFLLQEDLDAAGAGQEDLDGLVNYGRNIEGVETGLLFLSLEPELTKVNMRSRGPVNAADFMKHYGGGGHAAASGARVEWPLEDVRRDMLERLEACLGNNGADASGETP